MGVLGLGACCFGGAGGDFLRRRLEHGGFVVAGRVQPCVSDPGIVGFDDLAQAGGFGGDGGSGGVDWRCGRGRGCCGGAVWRAEHDLHGDPVWFSADAVWSCPDVDRLAGDPGNLGAAFVSGVHRSAAGFSVSGSFGGASADFFGAGGLVCASFRGQRFSGGERDRSRDLQVTGCGGVQRASLSVSADELRLSVCLPVPGVVVAKGAGFRVGGTGYDFAEQLADRGDRGSGGALGDRDGRGVSAFFRGVDHFSGGCWISVRVDVGFGAAVG